LSPVSCLGAEHGPALASCEGSMRSSVPSKVTRGRSWASIASAPIYFVCVGSVYLCP
jgi:hypothetical protein